MNELQKENQILKYLNKYYYVKDGIFLNRYHDHEYGNDIIRELPKIFSVTREFCTEIFKYWAEDLGIDYLDTDAYGSHNLKTYWSPELAQDVTSYVSIDAEAELTNMVIEQIAAEIDAQILLDLKGKINANELIGVIKCLGYQKSPTFYDPMTFSPRNHFTSMKKHEVQYERENNPHWQNWIRATR